MTRRPRRHNQDVPASSTSRRRTGRASLAAVLLSLMGACWPPSATGAPKDVANLPPSLQQYVPGSSAWASAPWMISPSCKDKGGDFSLWATHVVTDIPKFVSVFLADMVMSATAEQDRLRNLDVVKGFGQLSAEFRNEVPADYCVDDMKRWAGADPQYKPFGFAWGITHRTPYVCADGRAASHRRDADNQWVGAERAACDGFVIACDNAQAAERARCADWNAFSTRFTHRSKELREAAITRFPARGQATYNTKVAWPWVVVVAGAGATALAGMGFLIVRRRRTSASASAGSGNVAA